MIAVALYIALALVWTLVTAAGIGITALAGYAINLWVHRKDAWLSEDRG